MAGRTGVSARGPLSGVTVVDLSWHLAGPFCTLILADLGARVIKVEAPGSHGGYDPGGFVRHYYKGQDAHYMALNRNKLSVTLDLKSAEGKRIFKLLCTEADVVFNNFRAGVMERLGLGYEEIRSVAPEIVFCSLSSFGQDGPYATRPGVDLVVQALSGAMSPIGEPGRPPVRAGIPVGDLAGGMWTAIAILGAIRARQVGLSSGCELDMALLDGQVALTSHLAGQYFLDGRVPAPSEWGDAHDGRAFRCADDRYIVVAASDADLRRFLRSESTKRPETPAEFAECFEALPSSDWLKRLEDASLMHAPVNGLDEALAGSHVIDRKMVVEIEHSLGGRLRFVGSPIRFPGFEPPLDSPPLLGEQTDLILRELDTSEPAEPTSRRVRAPTGQHSDRSDHGPLEGLVVLETARHDAASYCALILADLGARVVKVEHDFDSGSADVSQPAQEHDARYDALNRNKESCRLNLRSAEGRSLLRRLIASADAVVSDLTTPERAGAGISKDEVARLGRPVVFCTLTPFGQSGPWRDRPATETMLQALSGAMSMTGEPGRSPRRAWLPIAELCGGMWAAIAVLSALHARDESLSDVCDLDISLLDGQLAMIPYFSAYYFLDRVVPGRQGSGGHSPTYGAFKCSDDRYVIIAVIDQAPWKRLCAALDCAELVDDPRFATPADRHKNGDELRQILERVFGSRPHADWEIRLEEADLAYARVNRLDEALEDPQVSHRGMRRNRGDGHEHVGTPVSVPGLGNPYRPPPAPGENTDSVLAGLGLGPDERSRLRASGVI